MPELFRSDELNPWLHRFAVLTAFLTLVLLAMGGLVTSHGVGLAVPDWPNTYGYNMFFFPISQWVGGIFYEHTHRLAASAVGLCTAVLSLWLFGRRARSFLRGLGIALLAAGAVLAFGFPAHRADALVLAATGLAGLGASCFWPRGESAAPWLRRLGIAAFLAVVLQGVLGGLRVVLFRDQIGIFHATLAQLFFALTCALALFTSRWWHSGVGATRALDPVPRRLAYLLAGTCMLIVAQLVLGATMRHQHAGLSIPDFPLAYGNLWPATDAQSIALYNARRIEVTAVNPITAFQVLLQMAHRLAALLILGAVGLSAWSARRRLGRRHPLSRLALGWVGLVLLQALLGAATIWSNKAADVATAHVVVGALSLALGAVLTLISVRTRLPARSAADSLARQAAAPPSVAAADPLLGSATPSPALCRTTVS